MHITGEKNCETGHIDYIDHCWEVFYFSLAWAPLALGNCRSDEFEFPKRVILQRHLTPSSHATIFHSKREDVTSATKMPLKVLISRNRLSDPDRIVAQQITQTPRTHSWCISMWSTFRPRGFGPFSSSSVHRTAARTYTHTYTHFAHEHARIRLRYSRSNG
jgi:hypothetical protein